MQALTHDIERRSVLVDAGRVQAFGELTLPPAPRAIVLMVQGLGAAWNHPRSVALAGALAREGIASLACDLFTADEQALDRITRHLRFDMSFLAERVTAVLSSLRRQERFADVPAALFGTGTGAGAALVAAATTRVVGVVSCGARTQLPRDVLEAVTCPALFIAGANDGDTIASHCRTIRQLGGSTSTHLVKNARGLDEPGAAAEAVVVASAWFAGCLERPRECVLASAA